MSRFYQDGQHLDYTPDADVPGGAIRQIAGLAGIANVDIPADVTGALCVEGVVIVISDGTAAFAEGATVGYDESADRAVAAGAGDYDIGIALYAVAATDGLEVKVALNKQDAIA